MHYKDTRKERSSRRRFGTTVESRENIRANKRAGNYRALVDGCFCRARASWNGLGDRVVYGEGIKGSREVQSMKGLDVKPLRVAIFSTLSRSAATATVPRDSPLKPRPFHLSSNHLPPPPPPPPSPPPVPPSSSATTTTTATIRPPNHPPYPLLPS